LGATGIAGTGKVESFPAIDGPARPSTRGKAQPIVLQARRRDQRWI
jgi:hypothetical protein